MEKEFADFTRSINARLDEITEEQRRFSSVLANIGKNQSESGENSDNTFLYGSNSDHEARPPQFSGHAASPSPIPGYRNAAGTSTTDLQGDFQALKETVTRVKLPAELRLNESRQGLRRNDQNVFNVLVKCARYAETSVKLLTHHLLQ